ncbi:WD40-repeat-containing domain protein, partial [Gorgonomyces haynaldii]
MLSKRHNESFQKCLMDALLKPLLNMHLFDALSTLFSQSLKQQSSRQLLLKPEVKSPLLQIERGSDTVSEYTLSEEDEDTITLYQGFRATYPALAVKQPQDATKKSKPSTHSQMFSDLLDERDALLHLKKDLDSQEQTLASELQSIEDMMAKMDTRKQQILEQLAQLADENKDVTRKASVLEDRIQSLGDTKMQLERLSMRSNRMSMDVESEAMVEVGACYKTLFGHEDSVECLDFEHMYGLLATGSADKTVRVWDLGTNQCKAILTGHTGWVRSVQVTGNMLVSGSSDHTVKLWDLSGVEQHTPDTQPERLVRTFQAHSGGISCVQFDDTRLLSGSADKTIKHWDMETGMVLATYQVDPSAESIENHASFPEDTEYSYASLMTNSDFAGWTHISAGVPTFSTGGQVASMYFYQYALAAGYGDGAVRLWDLRSGICHRQLLSHVSCVSCVQFDETQLFSGSLDTSFKIWDLRMGHVLETINFSSGLTSLYADPRRVSVCAGSANVQVYTRRTGNIKDMEGHSKPVRCARQQGPRLVSGALDATIKLWTLD